MGVLNFSINNTPVFVSAVVTCENVNKRPPKKTVGLFMSRLQIRLFGPYFSSFSVRSYGYEPSNELKPDLKHPNFRFGPFSPTAS